MELLQGIGQSGDWKFLYQGKEYVDAFGLNEYDFHARGYDAWTGRFNGVDPVANFMLSGCADIANNPTAYIDPGGRNPLLIVAIGGITNGLAEKHKGKAFGQEHGREKSLVVLVV